MIEIRPLTLDDAEAFWVLRLRALRESPQAFGSSYEESLQLTRDEVRERIKIRNIGGDNFVLLAVVGGEFVGMTGFYRQTSLKMSHKGVVWGMFVDADHRGKGIGKALLKASIERARQIPGLEQLHLTVVVDQDPARNLYLTLGFVPWGLEKQALKVDNHYYDEEYMVLFLDSVGG